MCPERFEQVVPNHFFVSPLLMLPNRVPDLGTPVEHWGPGIHCLMRGTPPAHILPHYFRILMEGDLNMQVLHDNSPEPDPSTGSPKHLNAAASPSRIPQAAECVFASRDGAPVAYRHWASPTNARRLAVILLHRGHEHSGRIAHLVDELTSLISTSLLGTPAVTVYPRRARRQPEFRRSGQRPGCLRTPYRSRPWHPRPEHRHRRPERSAPYSLPPGCMTTHQDTRPCPRCSSLPGEALRALRAPGSQALQQDPRQVS